MKVKVTLTAEDLISNKKTVLAEGAALYDGKRLLYKEKNTGAKHEITHTDEGLTIRRSGDVVSETFLPHHGQGTSSVISEYGTMQVDAICEYILINEDKWTVTYRIESQGDVSLHQRLEWHIDRFV